MVEAGTKGAFSGESSLAFQGTCGIVAWDIASEEIRTKQSQSEKPESKYFLQKSDLNRAEDFFLCFWLN